MGGGGLLAELKEGRRSHALLWGERSPGSGHTCGRGPSQECAWSMKEQKEASGARAEQGREGG